MSLKKTLALLTGAALIIGSHVENRPTSGRIIVKSTIPPKQYKAKRKAERAARKARKINRR